MARSAELLATLKLNPSDLHALFDVIPRSPRGETEGRVARWDLTRREEPSTVSVSEHTALCVCSLSLSSIEA
jgi:hypothetical protein